MRKKPKKKLLKALKVLLICICTTVAGFLMYKVAFALIDYFNISYVTLLYTENEETLINPERGLYFQYDTGHYQAYGEYYNNENNLRIILMAFDLEGYSDQEVLPQEKIDEMRNALDYAKELGLGVVFRAAYNFRGTYIEPESFNIIKSHVEQMCPVLNEYTDIVMGVQAGFIGPYGEWHGSDYMDIPESGISYRVQLTELLLELLDDNIPVNLRRQMFIREAGQFGLSTHRLGIHNDALLATHSDMGTYVEEGYDREAELDWSAENIQTPINGGEMPYLSDYTGVSNVIYEFDKLQLTYLNRYYNTEVLESWMTQMYDGQNAYDYIVNHLGYRLSLKQVVCAEEAKKNRAVDLTGTIINTGFAKPLDDYQLHWVGIAETGIIYERMNQEYISKANLSFSARVVFPDSWFDMEDGTIVKIGILMTDRAGVGLDESYCIQLANDDVQFENGYNLFLEYVFNAEEKRFVLR